MAATSSSSAYNEGVVHLRLEGSCHGCPSSTVTMKLAIEKAIEEAAPEVIRIEVEGASPAASAASNGNGAAPKISQTAAPDLEINSGEWIALDQLPEFTRGKSCQHNIGGDERSFVQGRRDVLRLSGLLPVLWLGAGRKRVCKENLLTCSSCERRYDLRSAGQCLDMGELHLAPLPLLVEQDGVKIAVATGIVNKVQGSMFNVQGSERVKL